MRRAIALQAQGITAAQVNQQLRQVNVNAAGGRAEIAGSEQSVRVLGSGDERSAVMPQTGMTGMPAMLLMLLAATLATAAP